MEPQDQENLAKLLQEQAKALQAILSIQKEQLNLSQKQAEAVAKRTEKAKEENVEYSRIVRSQISEVRDLISGNTSLGKKIQSLGLDANKLRKTFRSINSLTEKANDDALKRVTILESESDLIKKQEQTRKDIGSLEKESNILGQIEEQARKAKDSELLSRISKIREALSEVILNTKDFKEEIDDTLNKVKQINKDDSLKFFSGLAKLASNIPLVSDFAENFVKKVSEARRQDLILIEEQRSAVEALGVVLDGNSKGYGISQKLLNSEEIKKILPNIREILSPEAMKKAGPQAAKELRDYFNRGSESAGTFKTVIESAKEAVAGVSNGFTRILGLITLLTKSILEADREIVEVQKSLVLTRLEALDIRESFTNIANESGNINISTNRLLETLTQISDQFGFIAKFSNETLVTMTKLTKQVGISAEAAGMLAAESELIDGSFDDIYKNTLAASYELQRQGKVQFDLRKILEATAKVTGQVRANLGANPEEIAKAVTQAKLFGAELEDISTTSRALLDFQSSIESELQAELLIGRDLNLELARRAALMGDMETVATEITRQAGNFTEFSAMNVIQQDALAQSLGLSSDRLADILFQQEVQGRTARELRALGKEELADRLEAQTLQQKFSASVSKLKGLFTDAVVAFTPIIQVLGDALELIGKIVQAVGPLAGTLSGAITGFVASGFNPLGALAGGIVGGISDISRATEMNDGIISDGRVITGPEGTFKLPVEDSIIAGTDLFGATPLSQMPDYQQVMNQTNMVSPTINQAGMATPIQAGATTINNQTSLREDSEAVTARLDKLEAAINNQTKVLAKGQQTIAQTKTKLQVGATEFGTDLNINSFNIQ